MDCIGIFELEEEVIEDYIRVKVVEGWTVGFGRVGGG